MKDVTEHIEEKHSIPKIPTHTYEWYKVWGDVCPQCGAEARFEDE